MPPTDPFPLPFPLRLFDPEAKSYGEWAAHVLSLRRQWRALRGEVPSIEAHSATDFTKQIVAAKSVGC